MRIRIGNGYDIHALAEGYDFWLGGIKLEHHKGCIAHSDGDTLIHAICDAMLGALSLGDIGVHFPDTSEEYKGVDSKILLSRVNKLIQEKGYTIGNIDTVICLQNPKIKPLTLKMRETISNVLNIPTEDISIKATTGEKIGFIGREEGVSAYATVLLIANN